MESIFQDAETPFIITTEKGKVRGDQHNGWVIGKQGLFNELLNKMCQAYPRHYQKRQYKIPMSRKLNESDPCKQILDWQEKLRWCEIHPKWRSCYITTHELVAAGCTCAGHITNVLSKSHTSSQTVCPPGLGRQRGQRKRCARTRIM